MEFKTELESHYEILNMMPDAIIITNRQGIIVFANRGSDKLFGYSTGELIDQPVETLIPEKFHGNHVQHREQYAKAPTTRLMGNCSGLYARNKAGEELSVDITLSPLTSEGQDFVVCALRDIGPRKEKEKALAEEHRQAKLAQLMLLSSQLNPHFIFNALNSVQYYVLGREIEPALNFISDFSQLMRTVLNNSMKPLISVEQEVEFLRLYLELEQLRTANTFMYEVEIDDDVDVNLEVVPPMLLQPYIENSIVHGIGGSPDGKIDIRIRAEGDNLICELTDNGIGRKEAQETRRVLHKSHSMKINNSRIELLNSVYRSTKDQRYKCEVEDLNTMDGACQGTRVTLTLPFQGGDD